MKILITGISGTLGTAFAELLADDHEVVGVDRNEESVARFKQNHAVPITVEDFGEYSLNNRGFDLVIHLATLKHIDLCEQNTNSCVLNNLVKTYVLFQNARDNGVDILFMSTDKAVEPSSMYGYSKALAEGMVRELGGAFARSGNILASNGSVMGIWDEAIKNNQPIRITHKEMQRYFITAEHAAQRIWDLYLAGERVIIPEMDREAYLVDLAREKLETYGYTLEDYPGGIEYIGLRPGEKLRERLV